MSDQSQEDSGLSGAGQESQPVSSNDSVDNPYDVPADWVEIDTITKGDDSPREKR